MNWVLQTSMDAVGLILYRRVTMAISKETFCKRIEIIKAADKKLKDAIETVFEKNPFLDSKESSAFPAEWIYNITEEHLRTLFLAVNDKLDTVKVAENQFEAKMEELRKLDTVFANCSWKPSKDKTLLDAEVDYYYSEWNFAGQVEQNNKEYFLEKPEDLYEYLKNLAQD